MNWAQRACGLVNTGSWCEGAVLTRAQRMGTPPSFFAGTSLPFFCLEFYFGNISNGFPKFSHQLYWVVEFEVGVIDLPAPNSSYLVTSMIDLGPQCWHLNWGVFSPQPAESAVAPSIPITCKWTCCTPCGCLGNWMLLGDTPRICCQGNTQNHCALWFGAQVMLQKGGVMNVHIAARNCALYFQSSCENQGVYQMGCNMLVSCPGPATHMPRAGHPQFSSQTGNMCYMGFEPITICMYMEVNQISCWILYIFHQCVNRKKSEKNLLYYLLWVRRNICMSNNECSSIMKTNQKDLQWMCCRECKKEPSVGWPMAQGWDN